MDKEYISLPKLAELFGVSRQAIQKKLVGKINAGEVKVKTEGNTYFIEITTLPKDLKLKLKNLPEMGKEKAQKLMDNTDKDLHFEKELWSAADKLRGNFDASDYKYIVLGLIFLKYISDAYYSTKKKLANIVSDVKSNSYVGNEEARKSVIEDPNRYRGEGVFFIPEKARWEYLRSKAGHPDIDKFIDEAMEEIEKENPKQLGGVLPKNYIRTPLEPHILGELVNIFSKIDFSEDEKKERDILGRVYEYFLGQFASSEGKRGGEFYTPRPIVKLLVEILEPYENSRVLDPCCGSGGMFVQSSNFLKEHHRDSTKIAIFGQESNPTTLKLCKMNLAIRGVFGNIQLGNTYYDDKFPDTKVDFLLANPPFNAEWDPGRLSEKDPRISYGIPPKGNANFLWIQHFISHLTPNGMAGFVMANGALAVSGKEGEIRKKIVEDDLVDVVIACPPKLFFNVTLPVSLWFVTKNKEGGKFRNRKGETLFIDARETFHQISRKQVEFTKEQIEKIAGTVRTWRNRKDYKNIAGFCKSVNLDEIAKNGYVLTPGRYVGIPEEIDDGIPFETKLKQYSEDLNKYFEEGKKLEEEIKNNLKKISPL